MGRSQVKFSRTAAVALAAVLLPAAVAAADFRSVAERVAVLYDAPSARATKLFVVSQYYPVEVMVTVDAWVKVRDATGGLAWIEKKFLSDRRTVLVKAATAEVRQSADEKSPLVFQAREGLALELAEVGASGWVKVRHRDGLGGYVRAGQVWGL